MLHELLGVTLIKRIAELLFIQRRVLSLNGSQRNFRRLLSFLQRLRSKILERRFEVSEIPARAHQRSLALFAKRSSEPVCSRVIAGAVPAHAAQLPIHAGIIDRYDLRDEIGRWHRQDLRARKLEWAIENPLRGRSLLRLPLRLGRGLSTQRNCGAESDNGKNRQPHTRANHLPRKIESAPRRLPGRPGHTAMQWGADEQIGVFRDECQNGRETMAVELNQAKTKRPLGAGIGRPSSFAVSIHSRITTSTLARASR